MFRPVISVLLLGLITFSAFSQTNDWAPVGATWWYNYVIGDFWGTEGYMTMESVKDTTIDGISCRKISWDRHFLSVLDSSVVEQPFHPIYTYEDSGKVYAWLVDSFYIIQDFTLGVGDTLAIRNGFDLNQLYTQDPYSYLTIDSVDTLNIYGKDRKVQYYRPFDSWHIWTDYCLVPSASIFNVVAVEGIGWDGFMFPVAGFVDPENGGSLRCYAEPGLGLNNCGSIPCDTMYRTYTGVKSVSGELDKPTIRIFRNSVVITPPGHCPVPILCEVYDVNGRMVRMKQLERNQSEITLSNLAKGIYVIRVTSCSGTSVTKAAIK